MADEETEEDEGKDESAFFQQAHIGNRVFFVETHDGGAGAQGGFQTAAVYEPQHGADGEHDDEGDRRHVIDEFAEAEVVFRADDDVRRVADEGCRATNIGSEDGGKEVGEGTHLELLGNQQRYRGDEQHRCHVIQQGRKERGDAGEHQHDADRVGAHPFCRADGDVLEHARLRGDIDQHHHAGEQPQRIEIHLFQRLVLIKQTAVNHQHRTKQRCDRAVELLHDEDDIDDDQNDARQPHRVEAEDCMRYLHNSPYAALIMLSRMLLMLTRPR